MKKDKSNSFFSIKNILIILIPSIIILMYLFLIRQNIVLGNKWLPISQVNQMSNTESFNSDYMYCANYNDIRNEKFTSSVFILFLLCFIITLVILIMYLLGKLKSEKNQIKRDYGSIKKIKTDIIVEQFKNSDERKQKQLEDNLKNVVYEMFCNLQMATMNFDYETLQRLLTDELYNSYYTSLEVLKSKSRKNIFKGFDYIDANFIDKKEDNSKYSIKVELKLKFYGYIVDTKTKEVIRGSREDKIASTYMISLVKYKNKSNNWIITSKEKINEN